MASSMQSIIESNNPRTSKYLDGLLEDARQKFGESSSEYQGIFNQYFTVPDKIITNSNNARHFQAEVSDVSTKTGLERMYRRVVVIDLVSTCASECSYCVRGYYDRFSLSNEKIDALVDRVAKDPLLKEVLITGGDPLVASKKLQYIISQILAKASNIRFIRIGTRLPVQSPAIFDNKLLDVFDVARRQVTIELACQINHPFELQEKTISVFRLLQQVGVNVYSQNVLLKRVNDNINTMLELYDQLRYLNIQPHYLFHAVPLRGTDKYRTSVEKGLSLISELTSSGVISGRAKPQYALITDIGKINLYHGSIVANDGENLIVKSAYNLSDRQKWNASYVLPKSATVNPDGTLSVKYPNGRDDS